jgi:hypothetical protein
MFDDGQWQTPAPLFREQADLLVVDVHGVGVPDVLSHPIERLHIGNWAQSPVLEGVALLVEGFAQMCVQLDAIVSRHLGRLAHQFGGHRKWRAWRQHDLQHRAGRGVVIPFDDADGILEDGAFVLHAIVRRQPAFRLAERHASARHREPDAKLGGGRDLVIDLAAVLEHIGVVEHRRAAGSGQLGAADQHRGARVFRRPARPNAIVRFEPGKQVGVLPGRQVAGENLVEMMVTVDEAGKQDMPPQIEHEVGALREFGGRTNILDHAVACEQAGIPQFAPLPVHRHDHVGILREQCAHLISRTSPSRWRGSPVCSEIVVESGTNTKAGRTLGRARRRS